MILFLASHANVNLLDRITLDQELPIKKLTGKFSLLSFVIKDMRHFSHVRYFVIDRQAIIESDEEMIHALLSFQKMYEIRVMVIAEGLLASSPFLQQLVQAGITNVATSENIETMLEELQECFSEQGMSRFIPSSPLHSVREPLEVSLSHEEKFQFDCKNIRIAVAGSDRRSGVTTTAMNLVYWINEHGGSACYLEENPSKHLAHILQLFSPEQEGHAYVLQGADFYLTPEFRQDYHFIVIDCGVLGDPIIQNSFSNADVRLLCGSAMPYELPVFYRALERCKNSPVNAVGMFVPESLKSYLPQLINQHILFAKSSHDLFDSKANAQFYYEVFKEYIKEPPKNAEALSD